MNAKSAARSPLPKRELVLLVAGVAASPVALWRDELVSAGFSTVRTATLGGASGTLAQGQVGVLVLHLAGVSLAEQRIFTEVLQTAGATPVIVLVNPGQKAETYAQLGAVEALSLPLAPGALAASIRRASTAAPAEADPSKPPRRAPAQEDVFLGSSPPMACVRGVIAAVAPSMASIFITGESGTGKELAAEAIHKTSPRGEGPFIALNCGAIPPDLLESEVFGHLKGSFTGALTDKPGAAQAADGGTLFLDEICEMALPLQTKLLRFLQTSMVLPVGATKPRRVDVRIISATNRDPMDFVRRGLLREDLFYRLYVVPLEMPPLRDRGGDILEIARHALARYSAEEGKAFTGLSDEVAALFLAHPWPGNVRQLLNVIRNVVVLHPGGEVSRSMLPPSLFASLDGPGKANLPPVSEEAAPLPGLTLAEAERRHIEATLALAGGSVARAAAMLDVAPSTLYRKIESWKTAQG